MQSEPKKLSGTSEMRVAIDDIIAHANRSLRIFDKNLEDGGYATLARQEALRKFLLRSRRNRILIALHDIDYLTRHCARMMQLVRLFPYAIEVRQTLADAQKAADSFVLADKQHYWRRYHTDDLRSEIALSDEPGAENLFTRFEEIWQSSEVAVSATVLGL